MTNSVESILCGVDVSSETLDVAYGDDSVHRIPNDKLEISAWLGSIPSGSRIALEATGSYHEDLLDLALDAGFKVYVINGKQLHHYREAVGTRAKTDYHDARLLQRYLSHELNSLEPVNPLNYQQKRLWKLLKRRGTLAKTRTVLLASVKGDSEVQAMCQGVIKELDRVIRQVEAIMRSLIVDQGWKNDLHHCQSIPGIGPVNALALVACYHRGTFQRVDQFIAYMGLDVRVRDSGRMRGKRKLSKRGEPEMRRLLYVAAMTFARHPKYHLLYDQMRSRGLSSTATYVALSRKLARIAFALMKRDEDFVLEM